MGIREWARNLGLWPRVALAISVGFLGLFAAFAVLGQRALQEGTNRLLEERLVIAQMAAAQIDLLLEEAVKDLEQARRFADFDPRDDSLAGEVHVLSHTYGRVGMFSPGISFLDAEGAVVLSEPASLYTAGKNLSTLPHIARALETRQPTISDPFESPIDGRPVVAVTVPVFEETRLLGLLSGLVDLRGTSVTGPLERAAALGRTGHAVLVDSEGQALASTFDLPFLAPGEHTSFYRTVLNQEQPVVQTVHIDSSAGMTPGNTEHVMAFAPLSQAPWGVAVGGDRDETFAGLRRLQLGLTLLGAAALLGIWAATLWGTRRMVRPVQHLTVAAERMADQGLDTPLQVEEGGEIGAMADALERMRQLLVANIEELADWNEALEARVAERTKELRRHQTLVRRLLRRTINAQEEERARLARELHDDIGQMLTAVQLSLDQLAMLPPENEDELRGHLARTRELTDEAMSDLRRIIAAVRPGILGELGLLPALDWVADRTLRPKGVRVTIEGSLPEERLSDEVETLLFRIAQESINNVTRHSQADQLEIEFREEEGGIIMILADDGKGFDPASVEPSEDLEGGLGLAGMAERAALVGGEVTVDSAPGEGTTVRVEVPIPPQGRRGDGES